MTTTMTMTATAGSGSRTRTAASGARTTPSRPGPAGGTSPRASSTTTSRRSSSTPTTGARTRIWAGTGEPNACGSGCEAGVGIYKSTNGGNRWTGPFGRNEFYNRAVGSIEVKPGNSDVIFAASGRAIRGLSNACCGGVDALIPGAPHFGLYRSLNGGQSWQLVHQGAAALCTASTPDQVSLSQTPCSPRGARRVMVDPVDPNTVYVGFFGRGIWRSRANGDPGTFEQIMAPVTPVPLTPGGGTERPEFDVVRLANGETRMYVGVGGGGVFARFRRNDDVRSAPAATVAAAWVDLTSNVPDTPGSHELRLLRRAVLVRQLRVRAGRRVPELGCEPGRRLPAG